MSDLISRKALFEEIKSLTVTVTGLRAGKGILHEYAKQYRDTLLRIINEQPTIEAVPVDRNRIIDEFAEKMYRIVADSNLNQYKDDVAEMIDEIVEQMKAVRNDS